MKEKKTNLRERSLSIASFIALNMVSLIRACPDELDCIIHVKKLHKQISKGSSLPFIEATDDDIIDFKKRLIKYIDYEESKDTRLKTQLSEDCELIRKQFYDSKNIKFRNPSLISVFGKPMSIHKAHYCIINRTIILNGQSVRHDPKCNNNRCLKHYVGIGTSK